MKELNGIPLNQRLAQGSMPAAEALETARAFADSLRRLHTSGAVHGALEPSCVILEGTGVSLLHREPGALTPYSAPEQIQGKAVDARSDIFAFGAILYEMLAGRKAFTGEGEELRAAIVEREPAPLAGVPDGVARLITRCLAKAPLQRWQRVQNLQMELKLLGVVTRREERDPESQERRLQEMVRGEIARMEERIAARLAAIEGVTSELRQRLANEGERLESATKAAQTLRSEIDALAELVTMVDGERKAGAAAVAEAAAAVAGRLDGLDRTLAEHGSTIESLGTAVTQSDDLIEHLVDELDALERSLSGKHKTNGVMAALSR
jgi:uncharacterized coiled-coil protein SlyX